MSDRSTPWECPGLDVLEWLMDNEDDLPIDDTKLLKRIGWVWASRVAHATTSNPDYDDEYEPSHSIAEQVFRKIAHERMEGERGHASYSPFAAAMRSTTPPDGAPLLYSMPHGWWLRNVMQLWNFDCEEDGRQLELRGGAFLYWYFKRNSKRECGNAQTHAVYWTKYNDDYHVVAFMLTGRWITMMSRHQETFFCRTTGCGVARDIGLPWQLEFVRVMMPDDPTFEYVLYDSNTMVGSSILTATNTCRTRLWLHKYLFVVSSDETPFLEEANQGDFSLLNRFSKFLITPGTAAASPSEGLVGASAMAQSMYFLAEFRRWEHAASKTTAISALLAQRARRRLVRVASNFLLAKAQAVEERRAADPVRKCAACAVEAVKSQLALGIEPATKRMCVSA